MKLNAFDSFKKQSYTDIINITNLTLQSDYNTADILIYIYFSKVGMYQHEDLGAGEKWKKKKDTKLTANR